MLYTHICAVVSPTKHSASLRDCSNLRKPTESPTRPAARRFDPFGGGVEGCAPHIGWRTEFRSMEIQLTDFDAWLPRPPTRPRQRPWSQGGGRDFHWVICLEGGHLKRSSLHPQTPESATSQTVWEVQDGTRKHHLWEVLVEDFHVPQWKH